MIPVAKTVEHNSGGSIMLVMGSMAMPTVPKPDDTESAVTRGGRKHVTPVSGPTDQNGSTSMLKMMYTDQGQEEAILLCIQLVREDDIHKSQTVRLGQSWLWIDIM